MTRKFKVEVVKTYVVDVELPEHMTLEEFQKDWEETLWPLNDGLKDIAGYAAEMAIFAPDSNHDGLGKLITSQFEKLDPTLVKAIIQSEDICTEVVAKFPDIAPPVGSFVKFLPEIRKRFPLKEVGKRYKVAEVWETSNSLEVELEDGFCLIGGADYLEEGLHWERCD